MKKILIVHTEYTQTGGEDIAVRQEISFLADKYQIEVLLFQNSLNLTFKDIKAFMINTNKDSLDKFKEKIINFDPDCIYIHNLWFKGSLGILKFALKRKLNVVLKLHNFRYDCTRSFFSRKHLKSSNVCNACGMSKNETGIINKYYRDSLAKSILVNNFGRTYFRLLKNNNLKLITMTDHHKKHLQSLGMKEKNVFVQPNPISSVNGEPKKQNKKLNQIVYAGRISYEKGLQELVDTWIAIEKNDTKLIIIGEGPLFPSLKEKVKNLDSIELTGSMENKKVLKIIEKSKAVVTATKLYEGQPTLLCEASQLSVPSIFPDSGGIKDFFPENSKFMFEQFNYQDMKKKLEEVTNSKFLDTEGERNNKFIRHYLDNERLLNSFEEILETKI